MTSKPKRAGTKTAAKINLQDPKLSDWLENWDLFPTTTLPSTPPFQPGEYVKTGFCAGCCELLEAYQPGGISPRHVKTKVPYGECPQMKRQRQHDNDKEGQ